jgi:hypothetical protein
MILSDYDRIAAKARPRVRSLPENDAVVLAPPAMNRSQPQNGGLGWIAVGSAGVSP